jgi:hypothetical protein
MVVSLFKRYPSDKAGTLMLIYYKILKTGGAFQDLHGKPVLICRTPRREQEIALPHARVIMDLSGNYMNLQKKKTRSFQKNTARLANLHLV